MYVNGKEQVPKQTVLAYLFFLIQNLRANKFIFIVI
jgi:hypothetical protein